METGLVSLQRRKKYRTGADLDIAFDLDTVKLLMNIFVSCLCPCLP